MLPLDTDLSHQTPPTWSGLFEVMCPLRVNMIGAANFVGLKVQLPHLGAARYFGLFSGLHNTVWPGLWFDVVIPYPSSTSK